MVLYFHLIAAKSLSLSDNTENGGKNVEEEEYTTNNLSSVELSAAEMKKKIIFVYDYDVGSSLFELNECMNFILYILI